MSSGFELPFQWDDGNHIAPVVFTKQEELQTVTDILFGNCSSEKNTTNDTAAEKSQKKFMLKLPSGPLRDGESFIDAGCGNGRVPLYVAAALQSTSKAKHNKVYGIDIEEDLIEKAATEAKDLGFSKNEVEFVCGDLRKNVDLLKSCHFVYCYLLPGELLTDLMMELTEEWRSPSPSSDQDDKEKEEATSSTTKTITNCRVIISHTWEIACLEKYFVGRAGEFCVYSRKE